MTKQVPIFINKPEILIDKNYLLEFIPNKGSREERLNATVRFSGYMSILLTLLKGDYRYLYIVGSINTSRNDSSRCPPWDFFYPLDTLSIIEIK